MSSQTRTKPMEILLVEDGLLDARVTILALRRSHIHHRLTLVRTVAEAIQFLKRDGIFSRAPRPDLLLLDLMLPDGSGLEILESMNGLEGMIKTTVVVLSASDDPSVRQRSDELGVHDFIPKPVSEEEFLRVVREHKRWMIRSTPVFQTV